MMTLKFSFQRRIIETTVNKNIISNDLSDIEVLINDKQLSNQLGNPIYLKLEKGIFTYKSQIENSQCEIAKEFLTSLTRTFKWADEKLRFN